MNCDSAAISMVHGMFGKGISDPQTEFQNILYINAIH